MHPVIILGSFLLAPLALAAPAVPVQLQKRTPVGIPTTTDAKTQLAAITVAVQGSQDGYDRDLFPTWIIQSGYCDTRETVLIRDGTNTVQSTACASTSGTWVSPYDGETWTDASDVDIDHMVPLSNAWKSGAAAWTTAKRQSFANDLTDPQLWTVTDNVNSSKGDRGPEDWMPPLASFYCTYAKAYTRVKYVWALTITTDEKAALTSMLETC
ncbi:hypothetical protein BJ878DRAFT_275868 [Calycina marina]|uniref:GmrSD restriction endonucleases C-terminal domain-containing protein n=1 Tax=Calycina marina TaxID=1763456 RepID=A0A9P7Z7Y7_9HELO|nr:hypothetical protein BJ878DRAFT_275868 [Calycina marina]